MRAILKSDRGSTSILVVMFMIVLMILGLSILTTTTSNTRLAEKKRLWLMEYYWLEGKLALELAQIDQQLDGIKETSQELSTENIGRSEIYRKNIINQFSELGYLCTTSEDDDDQDVIIIFDVHTDEKFSKHISIELKVAIPENRVGETEFMNTSNYIIVRHTELQDPFNLGVTIEFGDPFDEF